MLLIISLAVVVLFGVGLIVWDYKIDDCGFNTWRTPVGLSIVVIFGATLIVLSGICVGANIAPEHQFEQAMIEYNVLQYEEENGYITFAENVVAYNQKVNSMKKWANNPWVSCFYYDGCENLPYYEFDGFDLKGE